METVFTNARIVLADEVIHGSLAVKDGRIAALDYGVSTLGENLEGDYLVPGLVELHTDNFERHLMPRPKVRWPDLPALLGHDAEIAAAGITTVYDALGLGDMGLEGMRSQDMRSVIDSIGAATAAGLLRAEHRLHVRCELPAPNLLALFQPFRDHPLVGLISVMDHTPGQRQWENLEHARVYYCGKKGWTEEAFMSSIAGARENQERYAVPHRRYFVEHARSRGIPTVASATRTRSARSARRAPAIVSRVDSRLPAPAPTRSPARTTESA